MNPAFALGVSYLVQPSLAHASVKQLVQHSSSGPEMDEVIDLWGLIFPKHRNVWYGDEEERIHDNEEAETVPSE